MSEEQNHERDVLREAQRIIRRRRLLRGILILILAFLVAKATGWIWDLQLLSSIPG